MLNVKRFVVYSFWYECIQSVELFFNRLISLKSSEISWLYEKFNRLFSLKPDYISCVFASRGANMSFSERNRVIHLWEAFSLWNTQLQLVFEDLGWSWRHFGLWVAWRTHVWCARDNHHQVWTFLCLWVVCLMWFQVCKCDSCRLWF